ncbi:MAG: peptidoglycan-associated lipoprotein Pal [Acidobacteria bacterium]|nr:peptidoglycan-associated lipoprotein Pal [Acidobacteriota bacterium]
MRRSPYLFSAAITVIIALLISASACKKKVQPTPPPAAVETRRPEAPPPAAPTISLTATPAAIEKGESSRLSWTSTNATGVTIDNGLGTVEPSGSREVSPSVSTTYMARASGPGGDAVAEARVTVTAPPSVTPPPLPAISDSEFFTSNIKDIFFDYDQYTIREDARVTLMENARALKERPGIRILIEGHCDDRGSEKYNLALGDQRANAARDFLIGQGIEASRIDTVSYGEERPFCEVQDEECWQLNRRAHMTMR